MKKALLILTVCLFGLTGMLSARQTESKEADRYLTITIAVVNSEKPYHVATIRYYDKNGDILLNTSEEYKIDISKTKRFKTGSIRKTIPIYPEAFRVSVDVNNCSGLHESEFFVKEMEAGESELTFVFKREFERITVVRFNGIKENKPCSFKIRGTNTNIIYYGDFVNASKALPEEGRREDVKIEVAESSLYPYEITEVKYDVAYKPEDKFRYVDVTVRSSDEPVEETAEGSTTTETVKPAVDPRARLEGESRREWKKRLKALDGGN